MKATPLALAMASALSLAACTTPSGPVGSISFAQRSDTTLTRPASVRCLPASRHFSRDALREGSPGAGTS